MKFFLIFIIIILFLKTHFSILWSEKVTQTRNLCSRKKKKKNIFCFAFSLFVHTLSIKLKYKFVAGFIYNSKKNTQTEKHYSTNKKKL